MNAEYAWQSALGQLQLEMPKASFDTWVRDTQMVKFDDDRLTICARNAYARDWLESRLSSTVTRLLMGIMNQNVSVEFVVSTEEPEAEEEESSTEAEPESAAEENSVQVEADYDLAYDQIVEPDHVTLVSRYFLRHLKLIGPDLGWLYLAFRQAAYNAGGRSGTKRERFSGKTIAALAGIAERTFWNRVGKTETWEKLKGLVTTTEASPEWDTNSATPKRLPRRYIVHMTLPLTATDAWSLRAWLTAHVESAGGPDAVIEAAIAESVDALLGVDIAESDGAEPETVTTILHSLFGDSIPAPRLASLSTRLTKHIMPDDDRIGVKHFFVEHILPHLGAGPGWMITLLRDRCWKDKDTGESRNRVTVQGGYAEISGWMGLSRSMTVYEWLFGKQGKKAKEPGRLKHPVTSVYLREVSYGKVFDFATSPRTFDVLLEEVPLEIFEAALEEDENKRQAFIRSLSGESVDDNSYADCSIGFTRLADDRYASCSIGFTRFAEDLYATCRVFKSLNLLTQITNDSSSPLPPAKVRSLQSTRTGGGVGNQAFWDFDFLLKNNSVHKAKDLLALQKTHGVNIKALSLGFVSWLLYAYSPSGKQVADPISLAVRRLLENVHAGAGGDFDRLARLRPSALKAIFDNDLAGQLWQVADSTEKDIYVSNFAQLPMTTKRELYRRLFGTPD